MKKFTLSLLFLTLIVWTSDAQIKIMPLGNSITAGQFNAAIAPADNNSYRKGVLELLRAHNYNNTLFVGSNSCGDSDQPKNEGHSGWSISELQNGRSGVGGVAQWLPTYSPDIILLKIGTNDFNNATPNLAKALTNIDNLVAAIFVQQPNVKLVVNSLIPIWYNNNYFSYNRELVKVVKKYKALGRNIWFNDLHNCGIGMEGYRDRLHPNAEIGYPKMVSSMYGVTRFLLDSMSVNELVTNPIVANYNDRTIIRWHPCFGAYKFNVLVSENLTGPYTTLSSNSQEYWAVNPVPSDKVRHYIIQGYTPSNRLAYCDTVSAGISSQQAIAINCGNASSGEFTEDVLFQGGNLYWFYYATVSKATDVSTIPTEVFKTARGGNSTYNFANLNASGSYKLTLYFMEHDKTGSGQRKFNVAVNGSNILSNFDVYATAGGIDKAFKREFTVSPNAGNLQLKFQSVTDSAIINGIRLEPISSNPVITLKSLTATSGIDIDIQLEATGGNPPYTWSATSLPAGLVLSATGRLTGNVATPNTLSFSVTATDNLGAYDTKTLSLVVSDPIVYPNGSICEKNGEAVLEAENFDTTILNGDAANANWVIGTSYSNYSGTGYIQTIDNNNSANGSWATASDISYKIHFSTTGNYNVWLYRYGPDGDSNSTLLGIDGVQFNSNFDNGGTGSWGWVNSSTGFSVSTAGEKTLNIRRREDGYAIDKIILTTSTSTPTGNAQTPTLCPITNVKSESLKNGIFPNPVDDELMIQGFENSSLVVYDAIGILVLKTSIQKSQSSLDVSHLKKGLYILKITQENKTLQTFKIQKN